MAVNKMPWIPNMAAPIIKAILYILRPVVNVGSVKISDEIDVMAITIIMIGDTMPALTAASPKIRAPTMEMAELAKLGSFKSLSLKISNEIIIRIASMNVENGTFSRCDAILTSNCVGNISWLKVVIAIYIPGVNNVIAKVKYLKSLVIDILILLL